MLGSAIAFASLPCMPLFGAGWPGWGVCGSAHARTRTLGVVLLAVEEACRSSHLGRRSVLQQTEHVRTLVRTTRGGGDDCCE